MDFKTICCLGDSVANGYWDERGLGWFGRLQEMIAKAHPQKFGFNNLAMSGDRTLDVYHRLCSEAMTREPHMLVIAVGINDLIRWGSPDGPTDQSPQARHEIWKRLLAQATRNFKDILVIGLLPNVEERYPTTGYDDATKMWHHNADSAAYNAEISKWCSASKVPFLDVFPAWLEGDYTSLMFDGGHPNGKGHQKLADQVYAKMETLKWFN